METLPDGTPHGTITAYSKRGCRCGACRATNSAYARRAREQRALRAQAGQGPMPEHGTYSRYSNYKCRCEPCKEEGRRRNEADRKRRLSIPKSEIQHGAPSSYNTYGCRCDDCKKAEVERLGGTWWDQEKMGKYQPASRRAAKVANDRSIDKAHNHKQHWSSKEIETVMRDDLTMQQKADMLGRSLRAVGVMRYKCKRATQEDD